jgi:hypothetical protein
MEGVGPGRDEGPGDRRGSGHYLLFDDAPQQHNLAPPTIQPRTRAYCDVTNLPASTQPHEFEDVISWQSYTHLPTGTFTAVDDTRFPEPCDGHDMVVPADRKRCNRCTNITRTTNAELKITVLIPCESTNITL